MDYSLHTRIEEIERVCVSIGNNVSGLRDEVTELKKTIEEIARGQQIMQEYLSEKIDDVHVKLKPLIVEFSMGKAVGVVGVQGSKKSED